MSDPEVAPEARGRRRLLLLVAELGASAQAAIPGLYAWALTVAPAAWSRSAPVVARVAAVAGVVALVSAPLIEGVGRGALDRRDGREARPPSAHPPAPHEGLRAFTGPTWARNWMVWGFVLSSAVVWTLAPAALSAARLDGVRGALGMVGWALFAFASAGPTLRPDPSAASRIVVGTPLRPRSEIPRGDGLFVVLGVACALAMQGIGWGVASPERAVLVRLVTIACGIAVLGGATSIALARHATRTPASRQRRLRRALPWLVVLTVAGAAGLALSQGR